MKLILFQEEYNRQNIDSKSLISRLEEDLAEVRGLLMDGVQKLIDRGEKLDELIRKTQSLEISVQINYFSPYQLILIILLVNAKRQLGM